MEKRFAPRPPSQTQENPLEELPTDVVTDTLPVLCHMLWDVRWDDGSARKPSTITIFRQDDKFKACLSDKDSGMVCFITGETLQACLTEMEYHAANGDLPWRKQLDGQGGTQRIPRK